MYYTVHYAVYCTLHYIAYNTHNNTSTPHHRPPHISSVVPAAAKFLCSVWTDNAIDAGGGAPGGREGVVREKGKGRVLANHKFFSIYAKNDAKITAKICPLAEDDVVIIVI